ncbi:MAG: AraC family ligand binding domain-containing protein, partial [Burkholderiales bacterium]
MIRTDPKEHLRFARLQSAPGVECMTASSSFQPWHVFHERYTFPTRHSAAAGWFYRGRSHFMSDGSTSFLEPGEMHRNTSVHKRSEFQVLFIPPKIFEAYARELGHRHTPHFNLAQTDSPDVHRAVHEVCLAADEGRLPLEIESKLLSCVRLLLDFSEQGQVSHRASDLHQPVERARRLLRDR